MADKLAEIRHHEQRIKNAKKMFMNADITEQEYVEHRTQAERQIMRLQAELSEEHQVKEMLQMTVHMLTDANSNWTTATNEERQQFARNLFSEISYDLDKRRIVGFKLKSWAEPFLQMRVALADLFSDSEATHKPSEPEGNVLPPKRAETNHFLAPALMTASFSLN